MANPQQKIDIAKPHLDQKVAHLAEHTQEWVELPLRDKLGLLLECKENLNECANEFNAEIAVITGLTPTEAPLIGSLSSYVMINGYIDTLAEAIKKNNISHKHRVGPDERTIVNVSPRSTMEGLLSGGGKGEIWSKPSVKFNQIADQMKASLFDNTSPAKIIYVLAAGNAPSLTISDAADLLYGGNKLCLIKVHPNFETLTDYFSHIFAPLISKGFMDFCILDLEETAYLLHAPGVDQVHMTGGIKTQEFLAFGVGSEGEKRKSQNTTLLDKPFTSELGSVTPAIFAPGPAWKKKDVIANIGRVLDTKGLSCGHACLATQIVILPKNWEYTQLCKDELKRQYKENYENKYFYAGSKERLQAVLNSHDPKLISRLDETDEDGYPGRIVVEGLKITDKAQLFSDEVFASAIGIVEIEADSLDDYLHQAIDFANNKLWGNLSAMLIIHPKSIKELGSKFEEHIAHFKVGGLAINADTIDLWLNPHVTWGGYAGNAMNDAQGGIGFVHNNTLLDNELIEKSVHYGPFVPIPPNMEAFKHVGNYYKSARTFKDAVKVMFNLIKLQFKGTK